MATATKSPLHGLSPKQITMVEVLLDNPAVTVKLVYRRSYYSGKASPHAWIYRADGRMDSELARKITGPINAYGRTSNWADYHHVLGKTAGALMTKGVLVQLEGDYYVLSNEVRQERGAAQVALDELREKRRIELEKKAAWEAARKPSDQAAKTISAEMRAIRYEASSLVVGGDLEALIQAFNRYQFLRGQLDEQSALLKVQADLHGQPFEPYSKTAWL